MYKSITFGTIFITNHLGKNGYQFFITCYWFSIFFQCLERTCQPPSLGIWEIKLPINRYSIVALLRNKLQEAKTLEMFTCHIFAYLTWKDVTKSRKCIIQCFIINGFVQIFNEYVAHSTFAKWWITLRPHDAYWLALYNIKIHGVQSTLRYKKDMFRVLLQNIYRPLKII